MIFGKNLLCLPLLLEGGKIQCNEQRLRGTINLSSLLFASSLRLGVYVRVCPYDD